MNRIDLILLALLASIFMLTGCNETVPNIGTNNNKGRGGLSKLLIRIQKVPKKSENLKFGIFIMAKAGLVISKTPVGYIISNDKIKMEVAKTELFPNDPAFSNVQFFQLLHVNGGFAAKIKIANFHYRFMCLGEVTKNLCERSMKSIQIIRR